MRWLWLLAVVAAANVRVRLVIGEFREREAAAFRGGPGAVQSPLTSGLSLIYSFPHAQLFAQASEGLPGLLARTGVGGWLCRSGE